MKALFSISKISNNGDLTYVTGKNDSGFIALDGIEYLTYKHS